VAAARALFAAANAAALSSVQGTASAPFLAPWRASVSGFREETPVEVHQAQKLLRLLDSGRRREGFHCFHISGERRRPGGGHSVAEKIQLLDAE